MKRLALYPFLFVLYVILDPLARNLDQLDPSLALRPLAVLWLAAASGVLLFYFLFRDWRYAGYLSFLLLLLLLAFGHLNRFAQGQLLILGLGLNERLFLAICAGLLAILAIKPIWARLGGRTWLAPYLNLAIAMGLLFPVYGLLSELLPQLSRPRDQPRVAQTRFGEVVVNCADTPDIYYIVLDGYGRADVLAGLYGLDNRPFLDYLERKGFYVASESHTNYIQTMYSIPSSLNFNYIDPPGEGISDRLYYSGLIRYPDIMAALKRCGYTTVAIQSGFTFTDHPEVDVYLARGIGPNAFESLLLADSPVDILGRELNLVPSEFSFEAHRQRVRFSFEQLEMLYEMDGPKFVFAHIISPHPPFVFDRSGRPVEPKHNYYIGDGDDYQGDLAEYSTGYPAQVLFVNRKLIQVIDSILANSASPPVIILQGDHGPGSRLVWDMPAQTCLWERTSILNAYYLPGGGDRWLYPSISPVNSFRVVLNAYFDAGLPLLPDATYFSFHDYDRQAIDITAQRSSRANCSPP